MNRITSATGQRKTAKSVRKPAPASRKLAHAGGTLANADRTLANADRKLANVNRKVANVNRKAANANRKAANANRKVANANRKAANANRNGANANRNGANGVHRNGTAPLLLASHPHEYKAAGPNGAVKTARVTPDPHWRPEYLGVLYSLATHVAPYMPSQEDALVKWLENYVGTARRHKAKFTSVFGATATVLDELEASVTSVRDMLVLIKAIPGWLHACVAFKNIGLYLKEPVSGGAPLPVPLSPNLMPPAALNLKGIVGTIEAQVEQLRAHANWTQVLAEEFQVIPPQPGSVNLLTLDPGLRARFTGGGVLLNWRGAASIRGVTAAMIWVCRGSGVFEPLFSTNAGRFTDHHPLPDRPCAWIYRVQYVLPDGSLTGLLSEVSVAVRPSGANTGASA